MADFECNRCGKCCASLGPHISIERQLSDREYYCRSKIDNAIFPVHVNPEYRMEIADDFAAGTLNRNSLDKTPCSFLRKNPDGGGTACAIYTTRPTVCRDFRCFRMLIRNRQGAVCGRVIGKNSLRTEDTSLEKLWNEQVAAIPCGDMDLWLMKVTRILVDHDYGADPVD